MFTVVRYSGDAAVLDAAAHRDSRCHPTMRNGRDSTATASGNHAGLRTPEEPTGGWGGLPKPKLERDTPLTVRLSFEAGGASGLWVDLFRKGAGGDAWPSGLSSVPRYENGHIEVRGLPASEVERCVEGLRERVAATNREVERQLPELEARARERAATARRFDDEFEQAQGIVDDLFPD
jgi:hypothetical protein